MNEHERREPGRKRKPEPKKAPPKREREDVVFTPAKPFHRKKLIVQLLTVVAVAVAACVSLSIFFKVDTVSISGMEKYNYDTILEASQIQEGDSLLFFSRAEVSSKILQALPYVKSVRVGIELPGTVKIDIQEVQIVYSVQDVKGNWWLISSTGAVLDQTDAAAAAEYTVIQGVVLQNPEVGQQAVASESSVSNMENPVTVTGADRLNAALAVMQAMEKNEILNQFSLVDVTRIYDLRLWYGSDYQFKLGEGTDLNLKLAYVKSVLPEILADYPAGTLDVSDPKNPNGFAFKEFD